MYLTKYRRQHWLFQTSNSLVWTVSVRSTQIPCEGKRCLVLTKMGNEDEGISRDCLNCDFSLSLSVSDGFS